MTREQDIRKEVLFQLFSAGTTIAKEPAQIARVANRDGGFDGMTPGEAKAACVFFKDLGYVAEEGTAAGVVRYRITAAGVMAKEREL